MKHSIGVVNTLLKLQNCVLVIFIAKAFKQVRKYFLEFIIQNTEIVTVCEVRVEDLKVLIIERKPEAYILVLENEVNISSDQVYSLHHFLYLL